MIEGTDSRAGDPLTRDKNQTNELHSFWIILFGGLLVLFYFGWVTGFTFRFQEVHVFPNYNMLARAFEKGQLYIDESPDVDYLLFQSRKYLYFGAVPALWHLPVTVFGGELPTGLAVILLAAGSAVMFYMLLLRVQPPGENFQPAVLLFTLVFAFNGFTLMMVGIPSLHHEAIYAGVFFLLAGLYSISGALTSSQPLTWGNAAICGLCFALSVGSRFSYVLTVLFFSGLIIANRSVTSSEGARRKQFTAGVIMLFPVLAAVGLQFAYNYLRFGAVGDFGVKHMTTLFTQYFAEGNYFRWDHIPYNLWSYLFRLPDVVPHVPFIRLPFYYLGVKSFQSMDYYLVNVNELSVSVFVLMPILAFGLIPLFFEGSEKSEKSLFKIFLIAVALQILPLSATVASIARYYMDFLPVMLIVAFRGYCIIQKRLSSKYFLVVLTAIISVVSSFFVVINGLLFYADFIEYKSPLLRFW